MCYKPEYCLCGVHVHTGSKLIAALTIVADLFLLVPWLNARLTCPTQKECNDNIETSLSTGGFYVLTLSASLLLVIGNFTRKPAFYWPFMIYHAISLICFAIVCFVIILFGATFLSSIPADLQEPDFFGRLLNSTLPTNPDADWTQIQKSATWGHVIALSVCAIVMAICIWVFAYFLSVVWRDYRFMRNGGATTERAQLVRVEEMLSPEPTLEKY